MCLRDYWKIIKHVEAQIQKFIIRTASGDCYFFAGCGKLGTKIINKGKTKSIRMVRP
jgi:hypothetical protein